MKTFLNIIRQTCDIMLVKVSFPKKIVNQLIYAGSSGVSETGCAALFLGLIVESLTDFLKF